MLLLDADPLKDIANSRRIAGVMLGQRWLARADLDGMLTDLAAAGGDRSQQFRIVVSQCD